MRYKLLALVLMGVLLCSTGCASNQTEQALKVIEETENSFVIGGKFADEHKELVLDALRTGDYTGLSSFCEEGVVEVLQSVGADSFVVFKQAYFTSFGKQGVDNFMLLKTADKMYMLNLYWTESSLYAAEIGEVMYA